VRLTVMLAALCHSLEQSSEGLEKTRSVLNALGIQTVSGFDVRSRVLAIIQHLGVPRRFYENSERTTDGDIRRLSRLVEPDLLYRTSRACAMAGSNSSDAAAEDWFIERARSLGVQHGPPSPLLLGRHLIEAGIQPGPQMGEMLRLAYEKQLDGEVTTVQQALAAALKGH
jgi:tRNA nucleotidyltransferase (CCA-adding enzyme)